MDIKVQLAGYAQAGYSSPKRPQQPSFGSAFHPFSVGILHTHILAFKVDLDILGTSNRLETTRFKYGSFVEAAGQRKPDHAHSTAGLSFAEVAEAPRETEVASDAFVTVRNAHLRNSWGSPRGYSLKLAEPSIPRTTLPDSHPIVRCMPWAKQNVAVSARSDAEEHVTVGSNLCILEQPTRYDLAKFLDNQTIVDEDIVLWVMVGEHHLPIAEDVPVISNFDLGFTLAPSDYFDSAPFSDLPEREQQATCGPDPDTAVLGQSRGDPDLSAGSSSEDDGILDQLSIINVLGELADEAEFSTVLSFKKIKG